MVLLLVSSTARSQSAHLAECDSALAKTSIAYSDSTRYDWRLSLLVTKDNYNEQKSSVGASAVIYGIPVGANYDEYSTNRSNFYSSHNESMSLSNSRSLAWEGLTDVNAKVYSDCISSMRNRAPGLYVTPDKATKDTVSLTIYYNAGPHDPNLIHLHFQDLGNVLPKNHLNILRRNVAQPLVIIRPKSGTPILAVSATTIDVNGDSIEIPAYPPQPPAIWELIIGNIDDQMSCQINGAQVGSANFGETKRITITSVVKQGLNTVTCQPHDVYKAYNSYPCWSYSYTVLRDNVAAAGEADNKCYPGAPDQPQPVNKTFYYGDAPSLSGFSMINSFLVDIIKKPVITQ